MTFAINDNDIQYQQARRGINAKAPIRFNQLIVGQIEEIAERICTPVTFNMPQDRAQFLNAALQWKKPEEGDTRADMLISDYARHLLEQAEKKLLSQ